MNAVGVWGEGGGGGGGKEISFKNEPYSVKRGLNAFAKSVDSCQPAQSAQANMNRNFSLS